MVKSVSYDQSEIINNILALHAPEHKIDCDMTFSKGGFYAGTGVPMPQYRFDIKPQVDGVLFSDCRNLPLSSGTLQCVMFDPPFLATTGKSLTVDNGSNIITKRFGVYPNEQELHQFYIDAMREAYRVLRDGGILIFKCQDKVSSNKQYMSHVFIMNEAIKLGFYPKDFFILLAKNRLVADWQAKNQRNARTYHCYFWVFEKSGKKVQYI